MREQDFGTSGDRHSRAICEGGDGSGDYAPCEPKRKKGLGAGNVRR